MGNLLSLCLGPPDINVDLNDWKSWEGHPAARHYLVGKLIGSGGFSEVYLAKRKPVLFDGEEVALKVIFLGNPQLAEGSKELLKAESSILKRLHHPNIVNVRRTYTWQRKQILVIEEEMLHGEDLLTAADEAISHYGFTMTESFAARVIRQLLGVLAYLHSRRVLHRDVKTENLRLTRPTKEWVADMSRFRVKLIDFGLSCVQGADAEFGWLGTPGYVAPEVIDKRPHSPAMDLYSAGVILFILLTGMKPVDNQDALKLAYSHLEAHEYPNMVGNARWDAVSGQAQSLVLGLMERDPSKRLTAMQALHHPFLKKGGHKADSAVAVGVAPAKAAADDAAAVKQQHRRETAAMKESDQLQVDGTTVHATLQADRWRELIQVIISMQGAVAGGSPSSASEHEGAPTEIQALLQKALRRGYVRCRRNQFQAGVCRADAAPTPRRALPRSSSMPSLAACGGVDSVMLPAPPALAGGDAGGIPVWADGAGRPARGAPLRPCRSSIDLTAGPGGGEEHPRHRREVAREQLNSMLEEHMMLDTSFAQDVQQLEAEAAAQSGAFA